MSYLSPSYTFHDNPNEHMGGLLNSTTNQIFGYVRRTQVGANRDDDTLSEVSFDNDEVRSDSIVLGPADKGKSWYLTSGGNIVKRLKE